MSGLITLYNKVPHFDIEGTQIRYPWGSKSDFFIKTGESKQFSSYGTLGVVEFDVEMLGLPPYPHCSITIAHDDYYGNYCVYSADKEENSCKVERCATNF